MPSMCHLAPLRWWPSLLRRGTAAARPMHPVRRWITHPGLALAATLMMGLFELLALARSRGAARMRALR